MSKQQWWCPSCRSLSTPIPRQGYRCPNLLPADFPFDECGHVIDDVGYCGTKLISLEKRKDDLRKKRARIDVEIARIDTALVLEPEELSYEQCGNQCGQSRCICVNSLCEPLSAPETTSDNLVQIQAVSKDPRDGQVYVSYRPLGTKDSWVRPVGSFRRAYRAWRSK